MGSDKFKFKSFGISIAVKPFIFLKTLHGSCLIRFIHTFHFYDKVICTDDAVFDNRVCKS
ncbi:hypothetical protein Barb6_02546 [Bacteroidales bacterium Barb6]|nr:hypothetical protein Barb6_02546 [Bacteroidales bacterium Barb6]